MHHVAAGLSDNLQSGLGGFPIPIACTFVERRAKSHQDYASRAEETQLLFGVVQDSNRVAALVAGGCRGGGSDGGDGGWLGVVAVVTTGWLSYYCGCRAVWGPRGPRRPVRTFARRCQRARSPPETVSPKIAFDDDAVFQIRSLPIFKGFPCPKSTPIRKIPRKDEYS